MKTRKHKTIDGETVTLQVPETEAEEAEIRRRMRAGTVDDGHGFADDQRGRNEEG